MGEWHSHLGEPLYYEEKDDMHEMTADQLAQLEDAALRIKAEQNPQEPTSWRKDTHEIEPIPEKPTTPEECLKLLNLMEKHFQPGLLVRLAIALEKAERKHPVFAEGPYQGIGRITEELGECVQSLNHGEPMERIESEAMDVLVTVVRFVRGDWKMQEGGE